MSESYQEIPILFLVINCYFKMRIILRKIHMIILDTDYGHTKSKSLILCSQNSNPNPKYFLCKNIGSIMKNTDNGLTIPKWVLIIWPKIPQMPQNLPVSNICLQTWGGGSKNPKNVLTLHNCIWMIPNSTWQQVSVQLYMCVSKKLNFCLLQIGQRHGKSFYHLATAQKDRRKVQTAKGADDKKVS